MRLRKHFSQMVLPEFIGSLSVLLLQLSEFEESPIKYVKIVSSVCSTSCGTDQVRAQVGPCLCWTKLDLKCWGYVFSCFFWGLLAQESFVLKLLQPLVEVGTGLYCTDWHISTSVNIFYDLFLCF